MSQLSLRTPLGHLIRSQQVADPDSPGATKTITFACDADGKRLPLGAKTLPLFRDELSGETYVRLTETLPSSNDSQSKELRDAVMAERPLHFVSPDGHIKGWFIVAPNFNKRETAA